MTEAEAARSDTVTISNRQRLFIRYLLAVLVDLTVLNLFVEYWDKIVIDSFTISLLAAVMLQIFLTLTVLLERRIANYFKAQSGKGAKVKRFFATWVLLAGSKFLILVAFDVVFGEHVEFGGIIPFVVVVIGIVATESIITGISRALMRPE